MRVGVLAVQGAFAEMEDYFRRRGDDVFEIRQLADLYAQDQAKHPNNPNIQTPNLDLLALPGGESTVQGKLLKELGLFDPLKRAIADGLPVFATCAGLILLAERLEGDPAVWFGVLPVTVARNAYGRQLGSFATRGTWDGRPDVPMTFIRAPSITAIGPGVEVLSTYNGHPTSVRWKNITAFTWHPELARDFPV
jgi:pyridoxal 5'-phosphate synthase pdxT subunit